MKVLLCCHWPSFSLPSSAGKHTQSGAMEGRQSLLEGAMQVMVTGVPMAPARQYSTGMLPVLMLWYHNTSSDPCSTEPERVATMLMD